MRLSVRVLRWLSAGIFAIILLIAGLPTPVSADTATYRILDCTIQLEPQPDGQVKITYTQTWKVLSGDIPWVTVGLSNTNFGVVTYSDAAKKVYAYNSSGFSGVRVDLDKDYQPNQTFVVTFTILQGSLLERLTTQNKWRINFTPGWYDRAVTDHLKISLVSPTDINTFSSISPTPVSTDSNIIIWEKYNLSAGSKFTVKLECLDGSFLMPVTATTIEFKQTNTASYLPVVIILIIVAFVTISFVFATYKNKQAKLAAEKDLIVTQEKIMEADPAKKIEAEKGFKEYILEEDIKPDKDGRYYDRGYGDYITPVIWAAILTNQNKQTTIDTGHSTCVSCACACVSCACACACACAGGGAAGCSKKSLHQCRECLRGNQTTK
jgi:hypothetical protein